MKASWEKVEGEKNQVLLRVEVDEAAVKKGLDQAFNKVVKTVNVPGFRKGKVPRNIFESRFGVEALYNDAIDYILPEAYDNAIKETGIEPVDRPDIDIEQFGNGEPFVFTAKVTVKPEVELGKYKGLKIEKKDFAVSDEAVKQDLEALRERHADIVVITDGEVADGDTAVIDFEGFLDDVAFQGGKGVNHSLVIGSGSFIPGFEEQVIGMKKDEERDINVTFPEEYHSDELAGKAVVFKVKLHEIKRKELPELDDEFAKDINFDTLEALTADVRKKLEKAAAQEEELYLKEQALLLAGENAKIDIPEAMIDYEVEKMLRNFDQQLTGQGLNLELYLQYMGMDDATLKEQFRGDAAKRVRSDLVLEAIAATEELVATEEEIDTEIARIALSYGREPAEIREILESDGEGIKNMELDVKYRKALDLLVAESK
jgi:trigger factor